MPQALNQEAYDRLLENIALIESITHESVDTYKAQIAKVKDRLLVDGLDAEILPATSIMITAHGQMIRRINDASRANRDEVTSASTTLCGAHNSKREAAKG